MTFFTSLSPSFIKIFSYHCNINFLPLQKLNKNSILLVFAPQSIQSFQYLTITRKEDRRKAIDCNLSRLLPIDYTELGHATSNPFHNFTFYSTFLKEEQDLKNYRRKSIDLKNVRCETPIDLKNYRRKSIDLKNVRCETPIDLKNYRRKSIDLKNLSFLEAKDSKNVRCEAPIDSKNYRRKSINSKNYQNELIILSTKFTPNKTSGPMVRPNCSSINQWVKKELQSDSNSSRSTSTQTWFKKDQRLTSDMVISTKKLDDYDISLGKGKSLSNSTSTSTLLPPRGSQRVRNAQVKSSKKVATLGRLGSVLRISLKNKVESILNDINVLLQPDDFCTDYYHNIPNTRYHDTSMVIICSYNKLGVFSQLKVTDNEDGGFIPKRSFKIIRPLLNCSRSSITKVCKHVKIPVYPDKSNESLQYSRNRIRKQILPIIQLFFNPKVENSIYTFAEVITKEQNLLATLFNSK